MNEKISAILDTNFFISFLGKNRELHQNANNYFKYFCDNNIELIISTISIAEFCVVGEISDLPLKNLKILPFNINHAKQTGIFAKTLFETKDNINYEKRYCIPNDAKLFAQANIENNIKYFVTEDQRAEKAINILKMQHKINFEYVDIHNSHNKYFGILF